MLTNGKDEVGDHIELYNDPCVFVYQVPATQLTAR